jgi:hypothetical protein
MVAPELIPTEIAISSPRIEFFEPSIGTKILSIFYLFYVSKLDLKKLRLFFDSLENFGK